MAVVAGQVIAGKTLRFIRGERSDMLGCIGNEKRPEPDLLSGFTRG
jgi:hypothetical protein